MEALNIAAVAKGHLRKAQVARREGDYNMAAAQALMSFGVAEYASVISDATELPKLIELVKTKIAKLEGMKA